MKNIVILLIALTCAFNSTALTKDEIDFFEKKIRPVLVAECYKCHSTEGKKAKGQLLLDNRDSTLKGGETGPSVVPNDLEQSLLFKAIRYNDKDLQMPPSGKLSVAVIADFERWIKMGAPDPRVEAIKVVDLTKEARDHWAYSPVIRPEVPDLKSKWTQTPIDSFILKELMKVNLFPSQMAPRNVLIRRVYFDLLGLPPTEQAVTSFQNDPSPNAYESLIDNLLNNPMYGERWGRHWLDTARYSDTSGSVNANREPRYTYSYTYRDYVIQSFNEDKPFNRFIVEQIAADQLKDLKKPQLAALGFLTLGKSSGNVNDMIDDQIDVIFKGFMATTMVCARCHDHKFDPISTKDYYAIHGIFSSTSIPTDNEKPILYPIKDTPEYRDYLSKRQLIETEISSFIDNKYSAALLEFRTNTFKNIYGGYMLNSVAASNRTDFIRESGLNPRMIQRWAQSINNKSSKKSDVHRTVFLPLTLLSTVQENKFKESFDSVLATNSNEINPFVLYHIKKQGVKTMKDLSQAYHNAVTSALITSTNISGVEDFINTIFKNNGPLDIKRDNFSRFYSDNGKTMRYDNELRQQEGKLITHELTHPATPARAMAMSDKLPAVNSAVLIKGDPGTRGPIVHRRFAELFKYLNPNDFTNGSGRLELAESIANPKNPLTARVIVNRVWQFHFGEGLVRSVDDFGIQTEKPIQYDLLNYLASRFIEDGWSIKKLHKLILTSAVYCQLSNSDGKKLLVDPYNKYYWKMNASRLDFETLRDTILFLGGKLDTNMGGQSVNLVFANNGNYSNRRTVYGLVDRGRLPEVFTTFDFATPEMTTGRRFQTIVPKQALFLMNNPMVIEQVRYMITRPEFTRIVGEEERIRALYRIFFQREPTDLEIKIGIRYMEGAMKEDMSEMKKEYNWKYGYRVNTMNRTSLSPFFEFQKFDKDVYSGTNVVFKGLTATRTGGTLSQSGDFYNVRRWTSPRAGTFAVTVNVGTKTSGKPSQINMTVYKNNTVLKTLPVPSGPDTQLSLTIEASVNDKIDFSISNPSLNNKDYTLAIKILELRDENSLSPIEWSSLSDFKGPIKKSDQELNSWERYTHILLLSNEMVFIN